MLLVPSIHWQVHAVKEAVSVSNDLPGGTLHAKLQITGYLYVQSITVRIAETTSFTCSNEIDFPGNLVTIQ